MYTSGCLNLTQSKIEHIYHRLSENKATRDPDVNETQLCEVSYVLKK